MPGATVKAHFHGGPFDGETLPVDEDELWELVALEETADGVRMDGPLDDDEDLEGRDAYRLSAEASGLEGDVEYAYVTPLTTDD
jgi:hypothetical protein